MAAEFFLSDEVAQDPHSGIVVEVRHEVTRLGDGHDREPTVVLEVATNLLTITTRIVENASVLLPEVRRHVQQLLHPDILADGSILCIHLTSHDNERVVAAQQVVVVPRIVDEVVILVASGDLLAIVLPFGTLGAAINMDGSVKLVDL